MKKLFIFSAIAAVFAISILGGCGKDTITKTINGSVQKGPFLNGTSITLHELDQNLTQTGKTFSSQITDNLGSFQINSATLSSGYVLLQANGFYFNEVCGSNSIAQLTLNGISDINSRTALNVNILTHLEKPRVEYLLGTGMPFDTAKKVAQSDVLNIFSISSTGIQNSEYLDISDSGDENAILLAISSILQGFRSESELSSLLASISNDISTDGVLNNTSTMSSIIDHAILLDTTSIRTNITNYYLNSGITPSIPRFEFYIQQFITNTTFPITNSVISYPATGTYGDNLLAKSQLVYNGNVFSMKVNLKKCSQFKIRFHVISGPNWSFYDAAFTDNCWYITAYDFNAQEQFFTVINADVPSDLYIQRSPGTYLIEYFETNLSTPSFSKTITVN